MKNIPAENAFEQLVLDLVPRYGEPEARSIARILFEDVFKSKKPAEKIFSDEENTVLQEKRLRLLAGEPIQYVTGMADFFGFQFVVDSNVLIPRQETEELADCCIKTLKFHPKNYPKVLDIGTGSGCIPITIKLKVPDAEVFACDISPKALQTARQNAQNLRASVTFFETDILNRANWTDMPLFDLIVSNPPYIPHQEKHLIPEHVMAHEPHLALFVNDDEPLVFYEAICDFAQMHLTGSGMLFFECNEFFAEQVEFLMKQKRFSDVKILIDFQGKPRIVSGIKTTNK